MREVVERADDGVQAAGGIVVDPAPPHGRQPGDFAARLADPGGVRHENVFVSGPALADAQRQASAR